VKKGADPALLKAINDAITEAKADGTYDQLQRSGSASSPPRSDDSDVDPPAAPRVTLAGQYTLFVVAIAFIALTADWAALEAQLRADRGGTRTSSRRSSPPR
jgi:hypothetical protein